MSEQREQERDAFQAGVETADAHYRVLLEEVNQDAERLAAGLRIVLATEEYRKKNGPITNAMRDALAQHDQRVGGQG